MSAIDEEPYSSIFASLKHPIRRKILRMLSKQPMSFMELVEILGVSNSFLTYHLENLGELVTKTEDGKYRLSSFGEAAMATMTKVEDIPATTPHQSLQTRRKKIVWKSVPFALGLICIVLIALVAYLAVAGISAQTSNSNLQNQNKLLQTWLAGNETLLNQTQTEYANLENQTANLTSQIAAQNNTISSLNTQISKLDSNLTDQQNILNGLLNGSGIPYEAIYDNPSAWVNKTVLIQGSLAEKGEVPPILPPAEYNPLPTPPGKYDLFPNYQTVTIGYNASVLWNGPLPIVAIGAISIVWNGAVPNSTFDTVWQTYGIVRQGILVYNGTEYPIYYIEALTINPVV